MTDAEEMELDGGATIFCFDATVECKLDVETIVADIEKMLPILEKYGVDYDGWGTYSRSKGARCACAPSASTTRPPQGGLVVGSASGRQLVVAGEVREGQGRLNR